VRDKLSNNGIITDITEQALDWLANLGYDAMFGARPLKRAFQRHIADPLAVKILAGEINSGDTIIIDSDDSGKFSFKKR
ncbi:MAG: hypothetical protein RBT61_09540, partial [Candidatus Kapabacteria bacterium]|jgi:ATP-dependent Clp protease ATP-binding subunit ClpB|nr:hypothetical protein [Candidatus Kapabacteria bacterium]